MRVFLCFFLFLLLSLQVWAESLSLREAVLTAFKHNPKLSRFGERQLERKYDVNLALSEFSPSIYLTGSYKRYCDESVDPTGRVFESYSWEVVFDWNLFSGFSSLNRYKSALHFLEAAEEEVRAAALDVAMDVVDAYIQLLKAEALFNAAKKDLEQAQANYELVKKRFEVGLAPRSDFYAAEADVAEAKYKLAEREAELKKAEGNLAVSMGLDVTTKIVPEEVSVPTRLWSIERAVRIALRRRPEILARKREIDAQKKRISEVKGEFWPRLDLEGSYGKSDRSFFPDESRFWSVRAKITFPIFTGFSTYSKLRKEKAILREKELSLRELELSIQREVWFAYQDFLKARKKFLFAKDFLRSAKEEMRVTRGKYLHGLSSVIDLTVSRARLSEARANFINAKYDLVEAYYRFLKTLGVVPGLEDEKVF